MYSPPDKDTVWRNVSKKNIKFTDRDHLHNCLSCVVLLDANRDRYLNNYQTQVEKQQQQQLLCCVLSSYLSNRLESVDRNVQTQEICFRKGFCFQPKCVGKIIVRDGRSSRLKMMETWFTPNYQPYWGKEAAAKRKIALFYTQIRPLIVPKWKGGEETRGGRSVFVYDMGCSK